jgi:hypothetical protein
MAEYLENGLARKELLRRVGHMSQLASVERYEMLDGKAKGCKGIEVRNGGGLEFKVLESKGLSISGLSYRGINMDFISKPGISAAEHFNPCSQEFPRLFHAGFLYTCGMLNVGPPCVDDGSELSQHGRLGQTPADKVCVRADWEGDEYVIGISGEIREGVVFRENLVMKRELTTRFGSKTIRIRDTVENQGFETQPLMMLYHINLGYPLLDEGSRFIAPVKTTMPRDDTSLAGMGDFRNMVAPVDHFAEQVFYHTVHADKDGKSLAGLVNERLALGVSIKYDTRTLPRLLEWKSMMSGDYTLGIEPANCVVDTRAKERERGTLKFIEPFEKVVFDLEIEILSGRDELRAFEDRVLALGSGAGGRRD